MHSRVVEFAQLTMVIIFVIQVLKDYLSKAAQAIIYQAWTTYHIVKTFILPNTMSVSYRQFCGPF
jgi:hypothetical protein